MVYFLAPSGDSVRVGVGARVGVRVGVIDLGFSLSVSFEMMRWHVGSPDLGFSSPALLEILGGWLVSCDLNCLQFFLDFDLFGAFDNLGDG